MTWTKEQIAKRLADIAQEKRRLFRLLEGALMRPSAVG